MKKICYSSIFILAFLMVFSCKKDKNSDPDLLIGKWDLDSIRYVLYENDVLSESETSTDDFLYLEFTAGKKFYVYSSQGIEETADWSRNGNILTLRYAVDDEEDFTIFTLTNMKLILTYEDTWQEWREEITVYLTRQD